MNRQNGILLGIAALIGIIAVYLANSYFSGMESQKEAALKQARLVKIAVAAQPIEFGGTLTNTNITMADWPAANVPAGAFTDFRDAVKNRVALRPLVAGEPVLASRVSGTDGRATLAANLPKDKLAIAVPISDVAGVAGFIRPGDAVDVILTRQIPGDGGGQSDKMADVLMEAVPVLAVDQVADASKTDPTIGKTATLQVDTYGAQRLALARELGTLSLALRNVASQPFGGYRTVTQRDLSASQLRLAQRPVQPAPRRAAPRPVPTLAIALQAPPQPLRPSGPTMTVFRRAKATDYEVRSGY